MKQLTQTQKDTLESLIDTTSLSSVVMALSDICHEKAEHIRTAWQDRATAYPWNLAGNRLERTSRA